jgi:nucleotide-binding universal stress UspA family protein
MSEGIQVIVCAVDFSAFSPLVVDHGVALAQRAGGHLHLIHAVHTPQDDLHPTARLERGGDREALRERARRRMAALMDGADLAWTGMVVFGDPVTQIAALVKKLPPCLVVSASHGISGFRRLFIGTVVERLTRTLNRPMLVVKPLEAGGSRTEAGFRSVLIGCDLHDNWQQAASLLPILLAGPAPCLHLLHVMEDPLEAASREADGQPYGQFQQDQQARIQGALAAKVGRLFPRSEPPSLSVEVSAGVPQEMLLRVADQRGSDLIVVGVRASGMIERWIAGSTTEALLRRSPYAVLTLPAAKRATAKAEVAR